MKNKKTPAIRFKGFTDDWEQRKLGECCQEFKSGSFISASDIGDVGKYPVYGGNGLRGFSAEYNHDGEFALIGRQGALCGNMNYSVGRAYFTEHAIAVQANKTADTKFLYYLLRKMNLGQYSDQSAQPGLAVGKLVKLTDLFPSVAEQIKIGHQFMGIDNLITLHQCKLEKLKNFKKAMLEKMFPKNGEKTPEIRFQGFTDDWEQRKLGNVTEELSDYDNLSSGLPLLTSARTGIMYQSDYRSNCTRDNEKTLFSVVPLNACTYRHMSDDSTFHININTLEKGLVSREYPVFVGKKSDLRYIVRYINSSNSFIKFCTEQKKGGTRTRLYYKTFCKYQMLFPSLDEQHIIANYFEALDNLITLHQRKLEKLKQIKKAMLEKMFV